MSSGSNAETIKNELEDKYVGMLVGLAIGDALGMPLEFRRRGNFDELEGMQSGGPFDLPAGYWTDDTSMALCLADSIIEKQGYDSFDVMKRYVSWYRDGYRSSTGECFDIGNQTQRALTSFENKPIVGKQEARGQGAGNGSIMRLSPIVIASAATGHTLQETARLSAISGRETHYSEVAEASTGMFGAMLQKATTLKTKEDLLDFSDCPEVVDEQTFERLEYTAIEDEDDLDPTGYVIDTLEVACWAFLASKSFKEGALKAVNMGGDSDTIGAVYGQLAGAYYGFSAIPTEWVADLHEHKEIISIAKKLAALDKFGLIKTRFEEDLASPADK